MMRNGFFKSFDGTKIFYSIEGSGPPLLFLYGLVCSKIHWQYQLEYFKKNYTVIWADYRGHHNSENPSDPNSITIENMARDTEILLDELGLDSVMVLGHSIGVTVALELYHRNPSRVRALVLANGVSRLPLENLVKTNLPQYIAPFLYELYKRAPRIMNFLWHAQGENSFVHWAIGHLGFNPGLAKSDDIKNYIRLSSKLDMVVFLQLLDVYEKYDATPWLHRIHIPTLIISGEKDLITPKPSQELMHQLIPGSRLEIIRNGSHCPQLDIPDFVNIILERFIQEVHGQEVTSNSLNLNSH